MGTILTDSRARRVEHRLTVGNRRKDRFTVGLGGGQTYSGARRGADLQWG